MLWMARAALANDQHRTSRPGRGFDTVVNATHRRAPAKEAMETRSIVEFRTIDIAFRLDPER
jgi:hypothetical protein